MKKEDKLFDKDEEENKEENKVIINEIEEERFHKMKGDVTNKINFYFKNNLRLHFLEKEVLNKEEEKVQRSLKSVIFSKNLFGQNEYN